MKHTAWLLLFFCSIGWADSYISLSAGVSMLEAGTSHWADCNPKGLTYAVTNQHAALRLAVGERWQAWGAELGYGRLGGYQRTLGFSSPRDDTVGEVVTAQALDARLIRYWGQDRLSPYAFAQAAAIWSQREVWAGHKEIAGKAVQQWRGGIDSVYAQWKHSTAVDFGYGGGVGAQYSLGKHWAATGEAAGLWGPLEAYSITVGVRYNF